MMLYDFDYTSLIRSHFGHTFAQNRTILYLKLCSNVHDFAFSLHMVLIKLDKVTANFRPCEFHCEAIYETGVRNSSGLV